jgi:hypothetical protein
MTWIETENNRRHRRHAVTGARIWLAYAVFGVTAKGNGAVILPSSLG